MSRDWRTSYARTWNRAGSRSGTVMTRRLRSVTWCLLRSARRPGAGDGHADLKYVYQAVRELAPWLRGYTVIVDKSTVPVGTARNVKRIVMEENPEADFDVASNPEFLREGAALSDFMRPDRVVIGVETERAEQVLRELYRPLNLIETPMVVTGLESAELIKYAANAFLATKISFINEMSALCEAVDADVHAVARGIGLDGRIGRKFLHPGPGYGGSCFPKDTRALVRIAQENSVTSRIVEAVMEVNEAQKARMINKIRSALGGSESGRTIAVLGLAFKPETDDMRDAPALFILPKLIEHGVRVHAHDPQAMSEARGILPESVVYFDDIYAALTGTDAVVLLTEWNAYRGMDPGQGQGTHARQRVPRPAQRIRAGHHARGRVRLPLCGGVSAFCPSPDEFHR